MIVAALTAFALASPPARSDHRVIVKLQPGVVGSPTMAGTAVRPLFAKPRGGLGAYFVVEGPPGSATEITSAFSEMPWVELAYPAFLPQPPPEDIPPETPDFGADQSYLGRPPAGMGAEEAWRWPGGDGANVAIADLEYAFSPGHEDLTHADTAITFGVSDGSYAFHGNGVLGILFADHNDYGVKGIAPAAEPVLLFPFDAELDYDLAAVIWSAAEILDPGDVLLIEQQAYAGGSYAPVEVDPAVFEAIAGLTALGILVVEPAGNGACDLDDASWGGIFDRGVRDSGAVLVGGGASPRGTDTPRAWVRGGSCYGARVDVQGWYGEIVTTSTDDSFGHFADLFFPDEDGRQAYTQSFGGTSGASAQVAGLAALVSSIWIELHGEAMDPLALRALLTSTGTPPAVSSEAPIGPQPDLRRLLRSALLP